MGWCNSALRAALVGAVLLVRSGLGAAQVAVMEPYQQEAGLTNMAVSCLAQAADGSMRVSLLREVAKAGMTGCPHGPVTQRQRLGMRCGRHVGPTR